jgi:hypothetical protein
MSLYYNLALSNTTNASVPLRFNVPLNIPFIQKPSDYDVSVIRFVLPNMGNSILTYSTDVLKHMLTMSYNGNSVTQHVAFIARSSIAGDRGIWDIQQCIQMLNATIGTLYTALNAIAALPTSDMPYFTYSETSKLISFTANKNFFASNSSTPIIISFDEPLLSWLYGMPIFTNSTGTLFTILVQDLKTNTVSTNYWVMTQQAPSFDRMADFDRVVLTCSLPIANEYLGTEPTSLPIIQDYCPADLDVSTYYNNIVYNAVVPYRQTRMISDTPFYSINFDCYTSSVGGTLTPMILPPNASANIKLMFIKHDRNPFC